MKPSSSLKTIVAALMLSPLATMAAEAETTSQVSFFSNPVFNILLGVIVLLGILIIALGRALKNTIDSDYFINQLKKEKEVKVKATSLFILFTLIGSSTFAATEQPEAPASIGGLDQLTFYSMLTLIVLEVGVLLFLVKTFRSVVSTGVEKKAKPVKAKTVFKPILNKLTDTVAVEEEEAILLDHEYDGIRELDNNLPPWWKWGFYVTIVVAVAYLINYHVAGLSPLQAEEYRISVAKGEAEVAEYMKTSANNVDENTVKLLTEPDKLASGKELYLGNCSACHGRAGEGGVGPNLTDEYWLHAGSVQDVFKSIKYGWPDKGMKAWKEDFSPMQIAELTSFIKSLKGTNPANAKEKQGELFIDSEVPGGTKDSSQVLTSQIIGK